MNTSYSRRAHNGQLSIVKQIYSYIHEIRWFIIFTYGQYVA
jgi:hypothetical protein